ncbi:hypothetical protein [Nocardia gipuzkoensis]|uniref:hypothetical protein n=1 Tax=Nocardia gipuzkoensis TaxID=2749991 RepID=UPI00237E3CAB|nr:hypothetical protein [Nocardia gipuzkoensis]MDE1673752.1 hypothetical protein [Nocardia gipuzkoensis]
MSTDTGDYARSYRSFIHYTTALDMKVIRDEGLNRHIRFGQVGAVGWFDLVTWPRRLIITGDMGDYMFAHNGDLFDLFEQTDHGHINPHYWATLLRATGHPIREVSDQKVIHHAVRDFWRRRGNSIGENAELFRAIRDEVLAQAGHGGEREALEEFCHHLTDGTLFIFPDSATWDLDDWSIHYLRACHAIVWGINRYREAATN